MTSWTQAANRSPEVRVTGGLISGLIEHGVIAFEGIPFAAPPIGALRWAPPRAVPPWKHVRPARQYGPECMQARFPHIFYPLRSGLSESCLYLNVWRPLRAPKRKLPVMVWIHGGGFVNGGSSPAVFNGTEFARDGVVLVSFNYRLGNFGFFAFPALLNSASPGLVGNYAFMDQIAALKWVQHNIAAFGGDPKNVTIFGESAGGMSVNALLLTPLARGLFQKAIIESGAGGSFGMPARRLTGARGSAEAKGLELARHFGIAGGGVQALSELRAIPAAKLVEGLNMLTIGKTPTYVGGPIMDGVLYQGPPTKIYAQGKGARVPVMIGANSADLGFVSAPSLQSLWSRFGPNAARARSIYDPSGRRTLQQVSREIGGDLWMVEPARRITRILAARGQRVYEYRFSYVASSQRGVLSGAAHASELPFVFDTVPARFGVKTTRADQRAARIMHAYWVAFAKTGRPDPQGLPAWPAYNRRRDRLMNFTDHGPTVERDPWGKRLDLIRDYGRRAGHGAGSSAAGATGK